MDGKVLKQLDALKNEVQFLRSENADLRGELNVYPPQLYQAHQQIDRLQQRLDKLTSDRDLLKQRVADLTAKLRQKPQPSPAPPAFVKANVPKRRKHKPGRKPGHVAALRPAPATIDVHQPVPFPVDEVGQCCCPHCRTQLSQVKQHERVVEDFTPSQVQTTCYHTTSGYCPSCRRRIETRADDQPPPADVPHAQLGLHALATAAVMRVCYRMPLRQIARLFAQLPGLRISPGAIVKQLKRLSRWLAGQYDRLKLVLRAAGVVYADETGWRINGRNGYLWTLTNAEHTLYHVDRSRGSQVILDLLGESFGHEGGGKLVSDFYCVYDKIGGEHQKCLAHLLRELRDTIARRPDLAEHVFFKKCKRLAQDMLRLKATREQLEPAVYARRVGRIEKRLSQLSATEWEDADAARLTRRLAKYGGQLTTFLHHDEVDGTNNAAERALRPAVVMRKITGGSRSAAGAQAWSVLASVLRTAEQQGRDVMETLKTLLKAEWAGRNIHLLTDTT